MHQPDTHKSAHGHSVPIESDPKVFGFWLYLMSDLVIFGVLFATYIVFRNSTFGGPPSHAIFHMSAVLVETLSLLTSSFTCALAMIYVHKEKKVIANIWFAITFVLGLIFLLSELHGFSELVADGNNWSRSAFLSSYFTLVGTHGTHIFFGLIWLLVCMFQVGCGQLSPIRVSRIFRMVLFWHFLDFVWIFIFTIVYGMGHLYA